MLEIDVLPSHKIPKNSEFPQRTITTCKESAIAILQQTVKFLDQDDLDLDFEEAMNENLFFR